MVPLEKVDSGGKQWEGAAMGIRTAGNTWCPALPGDLEAAASGNACNYTAEFPSPETAQHFSLLKPDNVRVTHVNRGGIRLSVGKAELLSQTVA